MKKKVLVFGSNGFIASSLKKKINNKKDFNIKFLDKKKYNLLDKNNLRKINNLICKNTVIIFISAIAPSKSIDSFNKNIDMAINLGNILKKKNFSKFIYFSSDAVYFDTRKKINENTKSEPTSLHGLMHITREKIFQNILPKKILILRPTLLYGENDTHNGYGPNMFIRLAKKNLSINLYGKGEEKRDHVYISDLIEILIQCIKRGKSGIFNISSGKVFSFYDLAKKIVKIAKSKSKIKFRKRIGPPHHLGLRQFNIRKIKKNFPNHQIKSIDKILNKYFINKY